MGRDDWAKKNKKIVKSVECVLWSENNDTRAVAAAAFHQKINDICTTLLRGVINTFDEEIDKIAEQFREKLPSSR